MPKYFSILRNIDTKILDEQIADWFDEHKYDPIILMSPDTLKEIPTLEDLGIHITKSTYNKIAQAELAHTREQKYLAIQA